ncbi:MAG: LapA family protein [Nitrospiraceae bacterium]
MITLIIALILALAIAAFALQNTEAVTVRLLLLDYQTSLVLVILGSAGIGIVLTFIASLGGLVRRSRTIRSLQATIESQGMRIRELEEALSRSREKTPPPASE